MSLTRMTPRNIGILGGLALLLLASPAFAQIETVPTGSEPTAAPEAEELQRGAYTEEQFEQEGFSEAVAALQEKQSLVRQLKIRKLEELLEANPYDPDKADLFFRLAEAYWEESHYQYLRARWEYDKAYEEYEAGRLSEQPVEPIENYDASLDYYRKIVAQFPDYARIDEIYYYLGLGALKAGKSADDRELQREGVRYFQTLVQDYSYSRFIADAHLKLGEYYFENNSLYYAKVNYEKIVNNYKTAVMYNYALYKLGWVYFNLREFRQAIETFQAVVEEIEAQGTTQKVEFKEQALNDLVVTFAEVEGGWEEAREYFMKVIGEEPAYEKLRKLADLFVGQDKDMEAIELYNHLVDYEPNSVRIPGYLDRLIDVRKRLNLWSDTETEMRRMIAYLDHDGTWWAANQANTEVLEEADTMAENTLLFICNKYHMEAQKEKDRAKYAQAASDYELFIKKFPNSKKSYVVNYYFAEILYDQLKDYERAAAQYEQVIEKDRRGEYVEDAALGVVYCYEELMVKEGLRDEARKGKSVERIKLSEKEVKERQKPIPRTPLHELEEKYIKSADKYVEIMTDFIKDEELRKKYPDRGADIPRMMFVAAQTFYAHGMFEDAVSRLRKIFDYDPSHEFAGIAVNTLLDAYVRLRHWDKVEEWARKLIAVKNFKVKSLKDLQLIIATAINEQARDFTAERRTSEAIREMQRLLKEFKRRDPVLAAKVMYNLAAIYERAHDLKSAIKTYQQVLKEYPKSEMAPEAQYTIGLIYEGQTQFVDAAEAFESFADKKLRDFDKAPSALLNAALLREAIQQYDKAIEVYETYVSLFDGKKKITNVPDVFFRIGVIHEMKGTPQGLQAAHDHYLKFIKKYPSRDVEVVEAYTRAAAALKTIDKVKHRRTATGLFQKAVSAFEKLGEDKKAGRARHQAARSLFEIAEYVFDDYAAVRILATDPRELKRVLTTKAELFAKAEGLYDKVFGLKSSGWTAGAMFRQGLLYFDFADNLLNAPIPEELPEELQGDYVMALEEFAGPVQEKSLVAFQSAMAFAREKGVYNKWSRQSGQYAARVNPDQFPLSSEPYVKSDRPNDTLAAQAFIRSLRRGDVEVQILKWQKKMMLKSEAEKLEEARDAVADESPVEPASDGAPVEVTPAD